MPFTLLWNNGFGLLARSFSITPIMFKPNKNMKNCRMIDVDVPKHCENPFWANDWLDCPVVGSEPLFCYYPMFSNFRSNPKWIGREFVKCLDKTQLEFLNYKLYFPSKFHVSPSQMMITKSDMAVEQIIQSSKIIK
jgi:hypothetical protein